MTASILVRGANFSGALKTNSIYPSYDKLVAAKFYGALIPDFRGFKKDKHFKLLTGDAAETNYGVSCGTTGTCVTGVVSEPVFTVAIALNPSSLPGTSFFMSGGGNASGQFSLTYYNKNDLIKISSYGGNGNINLSVSDDFQSESLAILIFSGGENLLSGLIYDGKSTTYTASGAGAGVPMTGGLDLTAVNGEIYSVSVFNGELNETEMTAVKDWLKAFYSKRLTK